MHPVQYGLSGQRAEYTAVPLGDPPYGQDIKMLYFNYIKKIIILYSLKLKFELYLHLHHADWIKVSNYPVHAIWSIRINIRPAIPIYRRRGEVIWHLGVHYISGQSLVAPRIGQMIELALGPWALQPGPGINNSWIFIQKYRWGIWIWESPGLIVIYLGQHYQIRWGLNPPGVE